MSKKQNLRNSLIYYLIIPLALSLMISLSVFLLIEFKILFIEDEIFNPGNHSVNPAIFFGILSFILLAGIFLKFDYELRQKLNLDVKIDEDYIRELNEKVYLPILDGKIKEEDIWHKISISEIKPYLKNSVDLIKTHFNVTETIYYYKNPKYDSFFVPYFSLYPYHIKDKYFVICRVNEKHIQEIVVSRKDMIFVNYNYKGDMIFLDYDDEEKKFLHPNNIEGVEPTTKSIDLFDKIKDDVVLYQKISDYMKKTHAGFVLSSRKKRLTFDEFKDYIACYRNHLDKVEQDFYLNEQERIIGIAFSTFVYDLKIKPEFFELARNLLKVICE